MLATKCLKLVERLLRMNDLSFREALRKRTLLLVEPREKFIEWVKSVAGNDPLNRTYDKIYSPSSCSAWLAKGVNSFPDYQSFEEYVENWKKDFLRVEVTSVYSGRESFPYEMNAQTFDDLFILRVVDPVVSIEELLAT